MNVIISLTPDYKVSRFELYPRVATKWVLCVVFVFFNIFFFMARTNTSQKAKCTVFVCLDPQHISNKNKAPIQQTYVQS